VERSGVIELPASLAAWPSQLAELPEDVALVVAPWLGRLSLAIGPLATSARHGSGEPDGYRGLGRRGSYERLVASEWALADLFPEEFVRRAAGGEHLFFELARSEPRAARRSVAIVSAGPAQLGAPRLAHLAVLIVLARRAAVAGASFAWGVLEDPAHRLHDALDGACLRALLAARTAVAAPPDAFAAWIRALGDVPADDVWSIGADEDVARAGGSRIAVRDVLVPNTRALDVEIERRGHRAQVRLDLPPAVECVRVLRDPSGGGASPSRVATAPEPSVDVRFAPGGRRLIVRLANGTWETWPVPSSARDVVGKPRVWTPLRDRRVLAVGVGRRSILAATSCPDEPGTLELHHGTNPPVRVKLPPNLADAFAAWNGPVGWCGLVHGTGGHGSDLALWILGGLCVVPRFALWPKPGTVVTALRSNLADGLGAVFFRDRLAWAERADDECAPVRVFQGISSGNQLIATVEVAGAPRVMFGLGADDWVAAISDDHDRTQIVGRGIAPISLWASNVVGVCLRGPAPALLTRPNAHRLALLIDGRRELLPPSNDAIAKVAVCASYPNVAWVTEGGEVVVCSLLQRDVRFRRTPGAAP
jgi:hypothetical protein